MPADQSVIAAMEAAVQADPANAELRLHLGGLLLEAGERDAALAHSQAVLGAAPDHVEALRLASLAASGLGDETRASAYERLLTALGAAAPAPGDQGEVVPLRAIQGGRSADGEVDRPTVTLADVGGMEHVKKRLETAFLGPMRNPELRSYYGKSLRGGLMLYGPPGCGKTFIARALAGELGARFQAVGLADVLDMWLGESERKLHETFQSARRSNPCVLFLDEVDALGQKRSHLRHSGGRNVVNQLLTELDSVGGDNEGVFVLAATNHPWDVDTALRRPGRFDRIVLVLPPDERARETILRLNLRDRPVAEDVDFRRLVKKTEGCSGADLAHLCEVAAESALAESVERGAARAISQKDLEGAANETVASTKAWFQVAYNYAMFANEGGLYDDLLEHIRRFDLA